MITTFDLSQNFGFPRRRCRLSVIRVAAVAVAFCVGCSAGLPTPTTADVAVAAQRWPSRTLAELEQGRDLYIERCAGCHALKRPEELPPDRWPDVVAEMNARPGPNLSEPEKELVTAYLFSASARLKRD